MFEQTTSGQNEFPTLRELPKLVAEDRRDVAESLVDEIAFMRRTMAQLKEHVATHGAVELYENGAQRCWRESPALKSYNAMVQRYSNLCKQLTALLPDGAAADEDELETWLRTT